MGSEKNAWGRPLLRGPGAEEKPGEEAEKEQRREGSRVDRSVVRAGLVGSASDGRWHGSMEGREVW